ncbi:MULTISPECIES: DUF3515 domain-containing protein [Actinosynnema]|uniref:DUF3515 domain-containing protein n=1 Tax=Actinosynnema TaxID=40566 RepID=UPI0020A3DEE4|nr:DUF3515 domain-containing protein [Actinosynnema pretiosum]
MAQEPEPTPALPRPLLVVAVGLPALLAAGVAAAGLFFGAGVKDDPVADTTAPDRSGPLALVPVPAGAAESEECAALLSGLPMKLVSNGVTLPRRELANPAPAGAVAWGDAEHDPVVLRCGLDRPAELKPDSQLRSISDVQWIEVSEGGSTTWFVVDRPVYVALTVPSDSGTGPLQDVSTTVRDALAKGPVDTAGPN